MKKTLSNRISGLIIAISIVLAIVFLALILNLNRFSQERELAQINYFLDTLLMQEKETLANEIFSNQKKSLTETLVHFFENEEIIGGTIYSVGGDILATVGEQVDRMDLEDRENASMGSTFEISEESNGNVVVYTSAIDLGGEEFGYIRLYYDMSPIIRHNRHMGIIVILLLGTKISALILILNRSLKSAVVEPIEKLEADMRRVIDGDFDIDTDEIQIYEIDQMKGTFNQMAKSLKESRENLESLVEQRTKELSDSKKMLSVIIDTTPTPLFYKDRQGRYTGCNSEFAKLLDKPKKEIIGSTIFDLMEQKYARLIHEKESEVLNSLDSQSYEGKFKTAYGLKDVLVNKASIVSETGEIEGLVAVMSDITYRKEMERELKYDASFQELMAEISSDFISLDDRTIDEKIMNMLKLVGEFFKSDRACICRLAREGAHINTYEWCEGGVCSLEKVDMPKSEYPYFNSLMKRENSIVINSFDEISPDEASEMRKIKGSETKSFLAVPIALGGKRVGLFGISMSREKRKWKPKEISLLKVIANVLIDGLERKNIEDKLKASNRELKKLSATDKLTQLYNRLKTDEVLEYELNQKKRSETIFSIILFDIDNFKEINDSYGHNVGDRVLVELSDIVKKEFRKSDTLGRWGGEEFIAICPDTELDGAISAAEKIRASIENGYFDEVGKVTCSFGVTEARKSDTGSSIVARADEALYRAKNSGRNKVEFK